MVRFSWPLNCDRRTHECLTAIRETRSIGVLEFEWHDGMASGAVLLYVAYTEREERIRLISARRATTREQDDYYRQNS